MKLVLSLCLWLLVTPAAAQTFPVLLKKSFWPDGRGELMLTGEAIEFRAAGKPQNSRKWAYADIQHLDRVSPTELRILTYEDQKWRFGQDREFDFLITEGEIDSALFEQIQTRLNSPTTNRVVGKPGSPLYEIPVKHLHILGGCEGTLSFTGASLFYRTAHPEDAREWRIDVDVASIWSQGPYQLEVHAYEKNRRELTGLRIYHFTLKQPLDTAFYRGLKLRLHGLAEDKGL